MNQEPRSGLPAGAQAENAVVLDAAGLPRRHGPSTATRLAGRLDVNSGSAGCPLRLAAAGDVAEDADRGSARDRWWRTAHQSAWFDMPERADEEPEAPRDLLQSIAAACTLQTRRTLSEPRTMPRARRNAPGLGRHPLRLTPKEAVALRDELRAVPARYRRDEPETAASAAEGAERAAVSTQVPHEPDTGTDEP